MSMTPHIGVYKISHWSYMCYLLRTALLECLACDRIATPKHHRTLLVTAREFFEPIRDFKQGENNPKNPLATAHAIYLYGEIMRALLDSDRTKMAVMTSVSKLVEIGDLVASLDRPRRFTKDTRNLLELSIRFFSEVERRGKSESYVRAFADDDD